MTYIFYTYFDSKLELNLFKDYLNRLPQELQDKITRFKRWVDQHASLLGKLLLIKGLSLFDYNNKSLERLSYNKFGRPYIDSGLDFNISHSGGYVLCSITDKGRLGIDVEKIRPIEIDNFKRYMTENEWEKIVCAQNLFKEFYLYWTSKESVMKANGKGISIPLNEIKIIKNRAYLHNTIWYLNEIIISNKCICHLAKNYTDCDIIHEYISPDTF